jgi:hypothetical protein
VYAVSRVPCADTHARARPAVEAAYRDAPAFARIFKGMVLAARPSTLLPRAANSTVGRKAALVL